VRAATAAAAEVRAREVNQIVAAAEARAREANQAAVTADNRAAEAERNRLDAVGVADAARVAAETAQATAEANLRDLQQRCNTRIAELEARINGLEGANREAESATVLGLRGQIEALNAEKTALEQNLEEIRRSQIIQKGSIEGVLKALANATYRVTTLRNSVEALLAENERAKATHAANLRELQGRLEASEDAGERLEEALASLDAKTQEASDSQQALQECEARIAAANRAHEEQKESLQAQLRDAVASVERIKAEIEGVKQTGTSNTAKKLAAEERVRNLEAKITRIKLEKDEAVRTLQGEVNEIQRKIALLKEQETTKSNNIR
jgi:chromosome segregation ATPase